MGTIATVFAALLVGAPAPPLATFQSRYGDFSAHKVADATPKVEVRFHGHRVFLAEAEEVELFRATPGNELEHIIVQLWSPGLNCQHSYALLTVRKDGSVVPSPVFGECHEMEGARWLPDGVELQLSPKAEGFAELETWRFRSGKLDHRVVSLKPGTPWASARKTLFDGGWQAAPESPPARAARSIATTAWAAGFRSPIQIPRKAIGSTREKGKSSMAWITAGTRLSHTSISTARRLRRARSPWARRPPR